GAAHRGRVPELLRRRFDRALDLPLPLRLARSLPLHCQRDRAEQRAGPGAEILRREILADDRLDVLVHVAILHVAELPAVDEGEQLLRLHRLQRRHDARHLGIVDRPLLRFSPLADVVERQRAPLHLHVLGADRGQAVRRLRLHALVVADAEEALVDEPHDRRKDALAVEVGALEIRAHAAAEARQRLAELDDAPELLLLAPGPEAVVVAILRPPLLVDAHRLQRRGVAAGDAHLLPRRRDPQLADALKSPLVGDEVAVGTAVAEAALFRPLASDAVEIEVPTAPDAAFPGHVAG